MSELFEKTAAELASLLRDKSTSSAEITRSLLDRIDSTDEKVRAFVTVTGDLALEMADEADRHPHRDQGQHVPERPTDDLWFENPRELRPAVRRDGRSTHPRRGHGDSRSGKHG